MNKKTKISSVSLLLAAFSLLAIASAAPVHASSQAAANAARAYNLYINSLRSKGAAAPVRTTTVQPTVAKAKTTAKAETAVETSTTVLAAAPSKYFFSKDLELGDVSADVKALQVYFNNNGYEIVSAGYGSKGHETDYFGNATKEALISFQKAHHISPAAGYFGPITRSVINK